LRKATISFVMSVRPSVHMEQLGSHWMDFMKLIFENFSKICREDSSFIKIGQE